jgi:acetate kinase
VKPVLVINSGSSSLKYQLVDLTTGDAMDAGLIERVTNHADAFQEMLQKLSGPRPLAIGHRVVHGGSKFSAPTLVTQEVLREIDALSSLAPLHNPGNAAGIRGAMAVFPDLAQVAVFDTAFHQTMPASSYRYAIDSKLEHEFGIRRYGFHGTSHGYVAAKAAEFLGLEQDEFNGIILHIGNGASACAVKNGKSFDTSMGLTPLQGLVMGTRSGDIDPAIVAYLERVAGLDIDAVDQSLNKNAGLKGMTGDGDLRDVEARAQAGDQVAIDALAVYAQRVKHYIGAYLAEIGPIHAVVFTAGVGENSIEMRQQIMTGLEHLGMELDRNKNNSRPKVATDISTVNSAVKILVVPTNEELAIALQAAEFIS